MILKHPADTLPKAEANTLKKSVKKLKKYSLTNNNTVWKPTYFDTKNIQQSFLNSVNVRFVSKHWKKTLFFLIFLLYQ